MNELQYNILKLEFVEGVKNHITEEGSLPSHITVFAEINKESEVYKELADDPKPAIIHIPIPPEYMNTEEGKEEFVTNVFPKIAKQLKKDFTPNAIAWVTEAWMRVVDRVDENWKDAPVKKEVLFINIESIYGQECSMYDIKRNGKQITEDGELVDKIELILSEDLKDANYMGGKFSGLFSNFKD